MWDIVRVEGSKSVANGNFDEFEENTPNPLHQLKKEVFKSWIRFYAKGGGRAMFCNLTINTERKGLSENPGKRENKYLKNYSRGKQLNDSIPVII